MLYHRSSEELYVVAYGLPEVGWGQAAVVRLYRGMTVVAIYTGGGQWGMLTPGLNSQGAMYALMSSSGTPFHAGVLWHWPGADSDASYDSSGLSAGTVTALVLVVLLVAVGVAGCMMWRRRRRAGEQSGVVVEGRNELSVSLLDHPPQRDSD